MDEARLAEIDDGLGEGLTDKALTIMDQVSGDISVGILEGVTVSDLIAEIRRLRYFVETVTVVCQNCGRQGSIKDAITGSFVCLCGAPLKEPECITKSS